MIMQTKYFSFVNHEWFLLSLNVWLKATVTVSNKYNINFIPKIQQVNNSNSKNDNNNKKKKNNNNNDNNNSAFNEDKSNNKILYWKNDEFCWKLMMSESFFKFL